MGLKDLRTTTLDGKVVEIITEENYISRMRQYRNSDSICASTGVQVDHDGETYILPFRGKTDTRPGIYQYGSMYISKYPVTNEEKETYGIDNLDIIDFGDTQNVKDFLHKNAQIREMEINSLTDIDSVFIPPISGKETPEMRGFKEAVSSKKIDINRYQPRFGDNFLNDKRILKSDSITMNKLVAMCEKLDIEAELTLRNANPNVPNPMPKEITVILTGIGESET